MAIIPFALVIAGAAVGLVQLLVANILGHVGL